MRLFVYKQHSHAQLCVDGFTAMHEACKYIALSVRYYEDLYHACTGGCSLLRVLPNMQLMHESHSNVFKYAFGADASIRGIGSCMCVDRNWYDLANLMLAPILFSAKYDILQLALLLQYVPPQKRWARIVARAQHDDDDTFLFSDEFREVVYLQLLLQHVCACRSLPVGLNTKRTISLRDIMNLLVESLKCGLTADHELLRDHLYEIHSSQSPTLLSPRHIWFEQDVRLAIPWIQKAYRRFGFRYLNIETVLLLLMQIQEYSPLYSLIEERESESD